MDDQGKTKEQLIAELKELREEIALFKALTSDKFQIVGVLRDFKEIYDNFYKSNPHPMWIYDLKTLAFLDVNNAAIKHYGYSEEEFLSMTIKDIRPPEDIPALFENVSKVTEGLDIAGTWRHIKKNGDLIYVEIISHTLAFAGRRTEIVLAVDITDRKKTEEALREKEERLASIFRSSPAGIGVVSSPERILLQVNKRLCKMVGYSDEELVGKSARVLYPTDKDFEYVGQRKYELIREHGVGTVETHWQCKDGRIIDVLLSSSPIDINNFSLGVTFTVLDITERKQAVIALQYSEEQYRTTIDFLDDALHVADDNLNILLINKQLLEWHKRFKFDTDVIGKNVFEVYPFLSSKVQEEYKNIFKTGTPSKTQETTFFNGREVITETKKIPIFEGNKVIKVITIMRDITERKKVEKELEQRMRELQDFYDMAVRRELRMKELKEENRKLREELEIYRKQ